MTLQRKLTLVAATGAVALSAGHFVQKQANNRLAEGPAPAEVVISSVTPVAAGPDAVAAQTPAYLPPIMNEATAAAGPTPPEPLASEPSAPAQVEVAATETTTPSATLTAPVPPMIVSATESETNVVAASDATTPQTVPSSEPVIEQADACNTQLDLIAQPGAMIGLTLLSPCHPDQRVVLRHAGLAVTGKTSASGTLFATLPALTAVSVVEVLFPSGEVTTAQIGMPELTQTQRFVVQWQDADSFQLHGFENGAGYDQPGHISAAFPGKPGEGAFITLLGDSTTDLPLLAEAYTFGPDANAQIVLEAAVTESTCGREILGETIMASQGSVEITDLSLAMPDCSAIGDILVLKNLVQDMKLAAVN